MIVSFQHKGLRRFFETGNLAGIQPKHSKRLQMLLTALHSAQKIDDMNQPGYYFHRLKGLTLPRWAVTVSANWRMTFEFNQGNAYVVDYEDYH
ncbi:type II toxin-antitoxin system RelE/ParE family toxin [Duganella hordei]|uniref:type II toxin-antitoxin system RelE/ParE family toxin n=1 Tax=Duganella hordei TaxID=2865934 RepID=UPI00159E777A